MAKLVEISTVQLLMDVGWAQSKSEARRMLASDGLRIDGEKHNLDVFFFAGRSFIMQWGRRKFIRMVIPSMFQYYPEEDSANGVNTPEIHRRECDNHQQGNEGA